MKKFVFPTMDVEKLDVLDVILTSGGCAEDCVTYVKDPDNVCPLD